MLKLLNTLTKKEEVFKPIKEGHVGLYSCGPTVYNYPHIGNYRAFIFADILKRYLKYIGYDVMHVMNITDIDDKTIRDSIARGESLLDFTEFYTKEFNRELKDLNIEPATKQPKATDHIKEMVQMTEELLEKGFAYKGDDGSVYFDIKKFKSYGKLSGLDLEKIENNTKSRIKKDEYDKENAEDFALWKAWDQNDGDVYWDTPIGRGRPGWHIECSAMSTKYLGDHFDIHTGGVDLTFPHHENEIAQSECASGHKFVNYWLHNEHLLIDGKKMSKSLKNDYRLKDLQEKGFSPIDYRYWLLQANYKTIVNFTWEGLSASSNALKKLKSYYLNLPEGGKINEQYKNLFDEAMNDNLNTGEALATLWKIIKDEKVKDEEKKATILKFDTVLGLGIKDWKKEQAPENILKLIEARNLARKEKNWQESDRIREEIKNLGYKIKDTESGTEVFKL
ncbi:MAG: cysteinyl-tRNA synthetase [Patescibacteria group bacterium]|jgi:cysteinyl-tRNA synthetase|nr:cysteinyl-tRNA synthetase [Patescibacteria group bacterium]